MKPGVHVPLPASTPAGHRPTQRPPQIEYLRLSTSPQSTQYVFSTSSGSCPRRAGLLYRGPRMPRPYVLARCRAPVSNIKTYDTSLSGPNVGQTQLESQSASRCLPVDCTYCPQWGGLTCSHSNDNLPIMTQAVLTCTLRTNDSDDSRNRPFCNNDRFPKRVYRTQLLLAPNSIDDVALPHG